MDNTTMQPYVDALSAQKAQLQTYATRGFQAIAIPTLFADTSSHKSNFLTKSATVFLVIGIIAFVLGLFTNISIVITGCASLLTAGYLYVHGKMDIKQAQYNEAGNRLTSEIKAVVENVSTEWSKFISKQNDALKKQIVESDATPDEKIALIDKIETAPRVDVDLSGVESNIAAVKEGSPENVYTGFIGKAASMVQDAITSANGAQSVIYNSIVTPAK